MDIGDLEHRPRRSTARFFCAALLALVPVFAIADGLNTSAEYIVGFARYVRWDNEGKIDAWRICIVGDVPATQDAAYANEVVRGKPFAVRRVAAKDAITECHIVDLTTANATDAATVLQQTRHLPILTVGNGSELCRQGGIICLHPHNADQKFEINLSTVRDSGLTVSARLLTLGASHSNAGNGP